MGVIPFESVVIISLPIGVVFGGDTQRKFWKIIQSEAVCVISITFFKAFSLFICNAYKNRVHGPKSPCTDSKIIHFGCRMHFVNNYVHVFNAGSGFLYIN